MKKFLLAIIALCPYWVGSFLVSCSDSENSESVPSSVWEYAHTYLMGFQGNVTSFKEMVYEANSAASAEVFTSRIAQFDAWGRITGYDPTGVVSTTRMLGMEINRYNYQYDTDGQLIHVEVETIGGEKTTYTIHYQKEVQHYVPLPFPLGPLNFFCVKGVKAIEGSDGLQGSWQNDAFVCQQTIHANTRWEITTTTTSYYTSTAMPYPEVVEEETAMGGEILSKEMRTYTYDACGTPKTCRKEIVEGTDIIENSLTTYCSWPLMACEQESWSENGRTVTLRYTYDNQHRLISIRRQADSESGPAETMIYTEEDSHGNWTRGSQQWNELVNANHPDIEVRIVRSFTYSEP